MNRELIERIGRYAERWHNYSIARLLNDCKAEIDRLTLANETLSALSALNVEYLERVKALELPKQDDMDSEQEPVAYVPMTFDDFQRIASSKSDIMHNGGWELLYTIYGGSIEAEVVRRMKEQGIV